MGITITDNKNNIEIGEWDQFVKNHKNGNIFQSPSFYEFLSRGEGFTPITIFAKNDKNHLAGVLCGFIQKENSLIKSFFSSRLIIWGAPLALDDNEKIIHELLEFLVKQYSKKSIYIEFRNLFQTEPHKEAFTKRRFSYKKHLNYLVELNNEEELRKKVSKSKIRQIKVSQKNGASIKEVSDLEELKKFYLILKKLYTEKVKKPLPDFNYFKNFFENKDLGKIFIVVENDNVLGGIVCPIFNNKIIYELYVGGEDKQTKKIYPSVLATWAPIEYGLKNNFDFFDFMGAGSPEEDYGVREFKSKFGGELVEYGRYIRINKPMMYNLGKIGLKILSKL